MPTTTGKFDIVIIGAGVVGLNFAFWISELYDYSVLIIEKEPGPGFHQSMRSTGGVHRPAFMDARFRSGKWMEKSYHLWKALAQKYDLPFMVRGRINLAADEKDAFLIENSRKWAAINGMSEEEVAYVVGDEVKKFEPNVTCVVGVISKTEAITSYTEMCKQLLQLCETNGVKFAKGVRVDGIRETADGVELDLVEVAANNPFKVSCSFAINAAGSAALRPAKKLGISEDYVGLQLRGEYWVVQGPLVESVKMQVYPLTRHGIEGIAQSWMGPHLVTRMDGLGGWRKELGPTAAPVLGPYAYHGVAESMDQAISTIFGDAFTPRLKMYTGRTFLSFAWNQWQMVRSKESVVAYLQKCIPGLTQKMVVGRGYTGVQVEWMNGKGFISEPVELQGKHSIHILYGGPGATGSPAYTAHVVKELGKKGILSGSRARTSRRHDSLWSFEFAAPD